jgi:kumamolisin
VTSVSRERCGGNESAPKVSTTWHSYCTLATLVPELAAFTVSSAVAESPQVHYLCRPLLVAVVTAVLLFAVRPAMAQQSGGGASGSSPPLQQIDVVVGLRWRDPEELERLLRGLIDRDSPHYQRYLSSAEFARRFAPSVETIEAVTRVLLEKGLVVIEVSPSRLFLQASGWVQDLAATRADLLSELRALTDEQRLYFYVEMGSSAAGDGGGAAGDGAVEMQPPTHAPMFAPHVEPAFSPADLAAAYGFNAVYARGITGSTDRGSTIAIATAYGFDRNDLTRFWADAAISRTADDIELLWVDRPNDTAHIETTIDVQWASSLAPTAPVLVYASAEASAHGFLRVYDRIVSDNRAAVMTTSWGVCEQQLSRTYLEQAHILFQRAAAQGITVLAASGDRGTDDCETGGLSVDFPAADPYVLAVGGTRLRNDGVFANEVAWMGSGGGTSMIWPAPPWQMHPSSYRVLADVALQADPSPGFLSRFDGRALVLGGTSLAAPAWAALLALVNQGRADHANAPLGVAAPALCEVARADDLPQRPFRDISGGSNGGFFAIPGWDFPTGWGTPRAPILVDALTAWSPPPLSTPHVERSVFLTPAHAGAGEMRAQFFRECARTAFRLHGRGLAPGNYVVSFGLAPVATFTVGPSGRTALTVRAADPRGADITVVRLGAGTAFSAHFSVTPQPNTRVAVELSSTGAIGGATGLALYERRRGRERFTVRVQNLPSGIYGLRLGTTVVAPLTVTADRSATRLTFSLSRALGGPDPVNPLCDSISVIRNGTAVLRGERGARDTVLCP